MSDTPQKRAETGSDWILPALAAAFAVYYLYSIQDLTWEAKISGVVVATALFVLIGIFFVKSAIGLMRGRYRLGLDNLIDDREVMAQRLILFGLTVAYILIIPWLGFTLTKVAILSWRRA